MADSKGTHARTQPTRWVVYSRVSSQQQVVDGGGLDTQEGACHDWVRANGGRVVEICSDRGVSGTFTALGRRYGWARAVDAMRERRADGIIVYSLDRLARDMGLQEWMLCDARQYGVVCSTIEAENDGISDDPTRVLIRQMLGSIKQYERAMVLARCAAGRARKRERGGWVGGGIPYGFKLDDKREMLIPEEREQAIIGRGLTLQKQHGVSVRGVGEYFVAAGLRLRTGRTWHPKVVWDVLRRAEGRGISPAPLDDLASRFLPTASRV